MLPDGKIESLTIRLNRRMRDGVSGSTLPI
jgi:hypothetical protein